MYLNVFKLNYSFDIANADRTIPVTGKVTGKYGSVSPEDFVIAQVALLKGGNRDSPVNQQDLDQLEFYISPSAAPERDGFNNSSQYKDARKAIVLISSDGHEFKPVKEANVDDWYACSFVRSRQTAIVL